MHVDVKAGWVRDDRLEQRALGARNVDRIVTAAADEFGGGRWSREIEKRHDNGTIAVAKDFVDMRGDDRCGQARHMDIPADFLEAGIDRESRVPASSAVADGRCK